MSELGTRLREAREEKGVSVAQAAIETRILQQSLVALEEGAYHRMPGDVVVRGFIRNYAQYLGLPTDEIIELYRRERGATDTIRIVPTAHAPRRQSYALPSFLGVFFVTIALVGLAYVTLNALGRIGDRNETVVAEVTNAVAPPTALATATSAPTPSLAASAAANETPVASTSTAVVVASVPTVGAPNAATAPAGAGASPEPTTTPEAPIVVELEVDASAGGDGSWVRVQTDGNTAFEGIMAVGERRVFQAQRRVLVRAGNPPAVRVSVNGLPQGALGDVPGQPVNWPWPPN